MNPASGPADRQAVRALRKVDAARPRLRQGERVAGRAVEGRPRKHVHVEGQAARGGQSLLFDDRASAQIPVGARARLETTRLRGEIDRIGLREQVKIPDPDCKCSASKGKRITLKRAGTGETDEFDPLVASDVCLIERRDVDGGRAAGQTPHEEPVRPVRGKIDVEVQSAATLQRSGQDKLIVRSGVGKAQRAVQFKCLDRALGKRAAAVDGQGGRPADLNGFPIQQIDGQGARAAHEAKQVVATSGSAVESLGFGETAIHEDQRVRALPKLHAPRDRRPRSYGYNGVSATIDDRVSARGPNRRCATDGN